MGTPLRSASVRIRRAVSGSTVAAMAVRFFAAIGLSQRLRQDGVDSWIDQYENGTPKEGWPRWMLNRLEWADFVLVVCSEVYYQRFRGKAGQSTGKGADWEGQMVTLEMYESKTRTTRFVPVTVFLWASESWL
jgi:TIR domain